MQIKKTVFLFCLLIVLICGEKISSKNANISGFFETSEHLPERQLVIKENPSREPDSLSMIEEDKKIVRELERDNRQKVRIKTRFVRLNSSEMSRESFEKFTQDFCKDICNPSVLTPLFSISPLNSTSYRDIDIIHHNEWWRRFYGGGYYSVSIMKYTKIGGVDVIAVYKTETKDKRVVEVVVDKLGNIWETAESVIKNVSNIFYFIAKISVVAIIIGSLITLEIRYKASSLIVSIITGLYRKYSHFKDAYKRLIKTKCV